MKLDAEDMPTPPPGKIQAVSATASSQYYPAMNAFDGNYDNFWHVTQADSVFPKWLQADLGTSKTVGEAVLNYGPADASGQPVYPGNIASDLEIWIGDNPTFAPGTYSVVAHITGNMDRTPIVAFTPTTGRYLRYVVNAVNLGYGHGWWSACMYEMDIWALGCGPTPLNRPPQAPNQTVATVQDTPIAITLVASDLDGDPLTYEVVTGPAHGTLTGTAPDLTYTPAAGYLGADSFTFKANDGVADSNVATVNISVTPPPPLPVIAAVASSAYGVSDTEGKYPMRAFDGRADTYWHIAQDNFGYADKWLQADLGLPKTIDRIVLDYGTGGTGGETIANDFEIWVGDDPTFAPGTYAVAASVTGNTDQVVTLTFDPPVTGRWVRYGVTAVTGPNWYDFTMAEMRIYGSNVSVTDVRLTAVGATASSEQAPRAPAVYAFDGRYDNFWHVNSTDTFPKWVQADLGSPQTINRVVAFYYGGYALVEDGNKARDFEIWIGNDSSFAPGTYAVAASVTGNDSYIRQVSFAPVTGRYVRYVVTAVKGTDPSHYWNANIYELEMWGPGGGPPPNYPPLASDQSVATVQDTPIAITLVASDPDGDPLTYEVVIEPAHGTLTGTSPDLTYTPEAGYLGTDRFTFKANDGVADSNVATVNISVTPPPPLPVIAAVASSSNNSNGRWPMKAFDGRRDIPETYWHVSQDNFGYTDKWLQADLGSTKMIDQIVLDYSYFGAETIAKDFEIWIGDDPTFAPGTYTVATGVTGNTEVIVTKTFDPPVVGRWVRYIVSAVTGPNWWDYCMAEMLIYGSDVPRGASQKFLGYN